MSRCCLWDTVDDSIGQQRQSPLDQPHGAAPHRTEVTAEHVAVKRMNDSTAVSSPASPVVCTGGEAPQRTGLRRVGMDDVGMLEEDDSVELQKRPEIGHGRTGRPRSGGFFAVMSLPASRSSRLPSVSSITP
jgi:hypothetical protein